MSEDVVVQKIENLMMYRGDMPKEGELREILKEFILNIKQESDEYKNIAIRQSKRRCDKCRHYDYNICDVKRTPTDEWYVPADGQCPRWEIK